VLGFLETVSASVVSTVDAEHSSAFNFRSAHHFAYIIYAKETTVLLYSLIATEWSSNRFVFRNIFVGVRIVERFILICHEKAKIEPQ